MADHPICLKPGLWHRYLSALLALCISGIPAHSGNPALLPLDAEQSVPWRGVGRLTNTKNAGPGHCTGTLIAADVVLTAAHCVANGKTVAVARPAEMLFVAGLVNGIGTAEARGKRVLVHPKWQPNANQSVKLGFDLALIQLERPIPDDAAVPFRLSRPPLPGAPVVLMSYRRDQGEALTRQDTCRYTTARITFLTIGCNVTGGVSGAPLFAAVKGQPHIVAVVVAKAMGGPERAFAARLDVALPDLLALLRTAEPSNNHTRR